MGNVELNCSSSNTLKVCLYGVPYFGTVTINELSILQQVY